VAKISLPRLPLRGTDIAVEPWRKTGVRDQRRICATNAAKCTMSLDLSVGEMQVFLADLVLAFHLLVIVFNIGGLLLIVVGGLVRWQWIRYRLWRRLHLALALLVAVEAWIGVSCPLTIIEDALRGQQNAQSFVGRMMTALIYWDAPAWFFIALYSAYLLAVFVAWRKWPPR
jgi:Protein of Unknown function (DUF2784)